MKIEVINLDSQPLRWMDVHRQLVDVGLHAVRRTAIAGAALSDPEIAALYSPDLNRRQYHRSLRPGEVGCYASHLAAWRDLLDSNEHCRAVLEDDVDVDPGLVQVLDAIDRHSGEWDVVKLIGRRVEKAWDRTPLTDRHSIIRYQRVPSLTGAYVISRRGAVRLLANRPPFGRPVDVDLRHWWECGIDVGGVQPYPVRGAASSRSSSIEDRREPVGPVQRWRKLTWQLRYSFDNWCALHPGARQSPRPVRLEDATVGRDAR